MMLKTRYTRALGDYVLEFSGLKSWTNEYSGIHLTIFYFGTLTILGLYLVRKYVVIKLGIRRRNVILLFIAFITIFSFVTNITVVNMKKHSDGLKSVGFNSKNSRIEFQSREMEYTDFNAEIHMINYGDQGKEFYLTIVSPFHRRDGIMHIDIFTKDGNRAVFKLNSNETKIFRINLNEYKICGGNFLLNGGGNGIIQEVILTDTKGNSIRLNDDNFFGVEIGR